MSQRCRRTVFVCRNDSERLEGTHADVGTMCEVPGAQSGRVKCIAVLADRPQIINKNQSKSGSLLGLARFVGVPSMEFIHYFLRAFELILIRIIPVIISIQIDSFDFILKSPIVTPKVQYIVHVL